MKESSHRLIRIKGKEIWLTPQTKFSLDQTNLPITLGFRDASFIYWQIKLHEFDAKSKSVRATVVDYHPIDRHSFQNQKMKSQLDRFYFERLEWRYLEPFLAYYKKSDLEDIIIDSDETYFPDLTESRLNLRIKVALKDIAYKLGYAVFRTYVEQISEEIEIRIINANIIPEFEFVKSFIARKIRRKYIEVDVAIKLLGSRVVEVQSKSASIEKIDTRFIDTIKYSRTLGLTKKPHVIIVDKSIFTTDEAFDAFEENQRGNVFNQNAVDIIQILSEYGNIRNRKQLQYLAGLKQDHQYKIHITLKPVFGFLFLIEGSEMYHFCWELLNSHATYLWSFENRKDFIPQALAQMEKTIQTIREQGRDRYKQAYRQGLQDQELLFQVIVHRQAGSTVIDPFPRWRQQLEEKLI